MIEAFTGISHRKYARSVELGGLLPHNADGQVLIVEPAIASKYNYFWYALPVIREFENSHQGIAMQLLMRNFSDNPYYIMSLQIARDRALGYGFSSSISDSFFDYTGIFVEDSAVLVSLAKSYKSPSIKKLIQSFELQAEKLGVIFGFEKIKAAEYRDIKAAAIKVLGSTQALLDVFHQIFAKPKAILVGWKTGALDSPRRIIPGHEDTTEIIIAAQDLIPLGDFSFEEV